VRTNGDILTEAVDRTVRDGEMPYQASRNAVKAFDIFDDVETGRREVGVMLDGIRLFISNLEVLGHDFETVARKAGAAVR
jgi:hypothetical protein